MALAKPFSGRDIRVGAGLAANMLTTELVAELYAKQILTGDEVLAMITGALSSLRKLNEEHPHPAWEAGQNLLRIQAVRFGGPDPGSKPT